MSRVWSLGDGQYFVIAAKGAPEAIAELCRLLPDDLKKIVAQASEMASEGLRVLGVAKSKWGQSPLPEGQRELTFELIGLVGLADPIRPEVPAAVEQCHRAGIRVIMITGDYPGTAQNIATQVGITAPDQVLTGLEVGKMNDADLSERVKLTNVYARMVPEQKLRLVNALKANGEVVAMTGDGVNDAPALKSAQIGIAMGGRGTDVARESADLVLLDDSFSSIVEAIRQGRRIFDNLQKAMSFVFAVHVPIAGLALIPVLARWPLILLPVHIVFLELIIDPACSIAFEAEPEEPGSMQRAPRKADEPLLSRRRIVMSVLQGLSVLLVVFLVFLVARYRGESETTARTLAFAILVIGDLMLILTNRSWTLSILSTLRTPNRSLWWVVLGAAAMLVLVIYVPFLQTLFRFSPLHPVDIAVCLAGGIASLMWFEVWKLLRNKASAAKSDQPVS
jgi:Ca2+-transporting ATPase